MRSVGWGRCNGGSPDGGDGGGMFSSSGSINSLLATWSCPYDLDSSVFPPFLAALSFFLRCRLSSRFLIALLFRSRNGSGVVSSLSDAEVPSPGRTPSAKRTVFRESSAASPARRQLLPSGAVGSYLAFTQTVSTGSIVLLVSSSSGFGSPVAEIQLSSAAFPYRL